MSDSVKKYYEMQEQEQLVRRPTKLYTEEQLAHKVCEIARAAHTLSPSTVHKLAVDELLVSNVCDE